MKIRTGFVSNSSSSSFLIYGTEVSADDFADNVEAWEMIQDGDSLDGLSSHSMSGEYYYIGASWSSVKDDETGKQFKERVEDAVEKVLGKKKKCETIKQAWYDG